ncbi:MAG TPA: hypothetical protein VM848_03460 [Acidimicrobiia bacterium]|nr:hypothetical protein [Acidimicrobiia bacterium]
MTMAPIRVMGLFALLVVLALAFMSIAAPPAWADHDVGQGQAGHDVDDDDSPSTTTTTLSPTTTTTLSPTTTTVVPPVTTTVPVRVTTTTTFTVPPSATTTTTVVPPPRENWEEQPVEEEYGSTSSTTTRPEPQDDFDSNETLVLSLTHTGPGNSGGGSSGSDGNGFHISPREGLTVGFRTAVEVIQGHLLQSMLLGILVAAFFMAGVDKRRVEPKPEAAPLLRSYSTGR